ncbi:hypothetical protein OSTOST_19989, partial [Ostertagia ostertagi]
HYLKKFSYNNTQASDLWEAFDEVVKNVEGPDDTLMNRCLYSDGTNGNVKDIQHTTTLKFKWDIPLWYQEGENQKIKRTWLTRDKPLYFHVDSSDVSIVVNADRHGFYRQNYDKDGWERIIKQLNENHR